MIRGVDVLLVMAKSANQADSVAARNGGDVLYDHAESTKAARAAVAELIEAADELIKHTSGCEALLRVSETETLSKAKAALARVRGAA